MGKPRISTPSDLSFSDGPLPAEALSPSFDGNLMMDGGQLTRTGMAKSAQGPNEDFYGQQPAHMRRNATERMRIQGLMRRNIGSVLAVDGDANRPEGGSMANKRLTRLKIWMVNDGSRRIFYGVWLLAQAMVFAFGFMNYQLKDNLTQARATYHITYPIARAAALVLHFDVAFILLPVSRNFISFMRNTPLGEVIPFDKNITFHMAVAWSIVFWTAIHVLAHMVNFAELGVVSKTGFVGFLLANFTTGPGVTGWIMTAALGVMVWFSREKKRRQPNGGFEKFWYTHHLFIIIFINWQLHGMFCMIKPDTPPFCSFMQIGVFWKYWLVGGVIYIYERVLREVRARHRTYISKVIMHPSNVCEVQIKKEKTKTRVGQYIFINCPEISYWQWHPFTLTSAPEEDYISVHIRVVGDFTNAFSKALGCNFESMGDKLDMRKSSTRVVSSQANPPLNRVLPRIMVDGPFGSASEDVFKFEVAVLCGAGIGVTPFASILKSIWYRLNDPNFKQRTRLRKVYFFWVIRDFNQCEWFQSLLQAIESQDPGNNIEIHQYLTAEVKEGDINNIVLQDVGGEKDAISGLRSPTHFGRPNWDKIFESLRDKHLQTDVGVFFCGPKSLGHTLHVMCNKHTDPEVTGTRFFYGKENF